MKESREHEQSTDVESTQDVEQHHIETTASVLSFDRILDEIGSFGLYQLLIGVCTGFSLLLTAIALFNFVFSSGVPDHRYYIIHL